MSKRIEKVDLNNQIVKMRKDVKRARLWLINNLNNKIKLLKKKKGSEQELAKNLAKVKKNQEEMQLLKKLDIDEISKFALCNQQQEAGDEKYLADLEPQQRALLRIANHKFVQLHVTNFRETYSVSKDKLILLIRSLGLQYQRKKKLSDNNSSLVTSNDESVVETQCCTTDKKNTLLQSRTENISAVSTETKDQPTLVGKNHQTSTKTTNSKKKKETFTTSTNTYQETAEDSHQVPETEIRKSRMKIVWPEMALAIDKRVGAIEVKHLTDLDKPESEIILPVKNEMSSSKDIFDCPLDSFFLGGVDLPEELSENKKSEGGKNGQILKEKIFLKNGGNNRRKIEKGADKFPTNSAIRQFGLKKTEKSKVASESPAAESNEGLHPSWQAKKRQKELCINLNEPQGKKIKFDD